ncbi:MAG: hypothetical protein IKW21_05200 [Lachnospiraceae bacterium]|nr:hypothetical protein [Lachnospiraceae bacterium]
MANLIARFTVTGVRFARDVIQKFMDEHEFVDGVPEDYKQGFYDFGNAVVKTLEGLEIESNDGTFE